jgi:hypothetical protein
MNKKDRIIEGFHECLIDSEQVMRNRRSFWYEVSDDDS